MGLPWSHWNQVPVPRFQSDPLESSTFYHPTLLRRVVKDYVEEATNYSPEFAGEEQLQAIAQYCQAPELLDVILDVLRERVTCVWPWNIKSLDVLLYLLQNGLHLPRSQSRSQQILKILTDLSLRPTDDPEGTAEHVKSKADECLVSAGYLPADPMSARAGGRGHVQQENGGFWGFSWGRTRDRDRDKEKEKSNHVKKQRDWQGRHPPYQQQQPRQERTAPLPDSSSAWLGLDSPRIRKLGPTSKSTDKPTESAWVTPLKDGKGFSFTTTTVTEGPPPADHFEQHQTNHASLLEETLRKRR